jgi:CRP/FNR family transcriptional activator FtrB
MLTSRHSARRGRGSAAVGIDDLKTIRLFAETSDTRLQGPADAGWQERVAPRTVIVEQDEEDDTLYAVRDGTVEVFSRTEDQETVIDVLEPGAALQLASVISGRPYAAAARALSPARLLAVPGAEIRALFDRDKIFARAVACELSRASYTMVAELRSLKTRTSLERLADWLAQQSNGGGQFRLPFGKRTLASRLGMTPECLSRSLRGLADHGVSVRGREVTVADPAALAARAGVAAAADRKL